MVAEGRLEIVAGRIQSVQDEGNALAVAYRRRGGLADRRGALRLHDQLHGTAGTPFRALSDPMLKGMLADGLARPDQLGIALEVDERSRVVGAERAWAMGPLTKGRYWEIIAVPDIRYQAAAVAEDIAMELDR